MCMDIRAKFGNVVRFFRKQKQISQEMLAELSGLDRSYVGGVERGERNISIVNIEKISLALGVDLVDMFSKLKEGTDDNSDS
jgi:transcriptional regulator with XRE-family HTH domain